MKVERSIDDQMSLIYKTTNRQPQINNTTIMGIEGVLGALNLGPMRVSHTCAALFSLLFFLFLCFKGESAHVMCIIAQARTDVSFVLQWPQPQLTDMNY